MIAPIFNPDCFKVISLFSLSPGSRFNRKEIKEKLLLNNVPLDKALQRLISAKVIKREHNYYAFNFEKEEAKKILEICTSQYKQLRELPLNIYYLIVDLINELSLIKNIEVFLFGSYAKLIYKVNSDVDIALLYLDEVNQASINRIIFKLEKIYRRKVEAHYFGKTDFYRNKKDSLVRNILRDGIRLI